MAKYDKKAAMQIIIQAVKDYEDKLNNKQFLVVYQEKHETKYVCVGF